MFKQLLARVLGRASARAWFKRSILYLSVFLILWAGIALYRRLKWEAEVYDEEPSGAAVFQGQLRDDTLEEDLESGGTSQDELDGMLSALRKAGALKGALKGDSYRIEYSPDGEFRHLTVTHGLKQIVLTQEGDSYRVRQMKVPIERVDHVVRGELGDSLWLSMSGQGLPAEVIAEYADIFQWTVDFLTEPRKRDPYAVIYEEQRSPDGRVWGREIRGALYDGKMTGRQLAVLFEGDYYDADGHTLRRMFLRAPLNYRRISSRFSSRRRHPILRIVRPHYGIDYAAPRGTPVVSVAGGRVSYAGYRGGFGKTVEIHHDSAYKTLYGHLSRYGPGIRSGSRVRQGQVIGYVGSTGLATGPHLDFRIAKSGKWFDFLKLRLPKASAVPKSKRQAFFAVRDKLLASLASEAE
ncbi:MAG: peptidoglycan DD-metalloendopeptidase family protein [Elusimicrobiota bacterium]